MFSVVFIAAATLTFTSNTAFAEYVNQPDIDVTNNFIQAAKEYGEKMPNIKNLEEADALLQNLEKATDAIASHQFSDRVHVKYSSAVEKLKKSASTMSREIKEFRAAIATGDPEKINTQATAFEANLQREANNIDAAFSDMNSAAEQRNTSYKTVAIVSLVLSIIVMIPTLIWAFARGKGMNGDLLKARHLVGWSSIGPVIVSTLMLLSIIFMEHTNGTIIGHTFMVVAVIMFLTNVREYRSLKKKLAVNPPQNQFPSV